ncbi:MAG: D-2-hydroxyacid dehydrogenase [Desulfosarcina sp.]
MKITATDGYTLNPGDNPWDDVAALGELTVYDRTAPEDLIERCLDSEIAIVNKTPFDAAALARLPRLKFITMAATGYDCIDIEAAGRHGVPVSNIPIYGTDTVAQYVFSAILHLAHNISLHAEAVQKGDWAGSPDWCFWNRPLVELKGLCIGIVGFGRIGRRVGEIASAFGMRVLAHDPTPGEAPAYKRFEWGSLEAIFERADVVTLHSPLTPDNREFVNMALLSRMKPSAFFINAARGGLVDEIDLAQALSRGQLAGAVVDVVSREPIRPDNPLLGIPNLVITPHIAWATLAARQRLMAGIVENIQAFLSGRTVHVVNQRFL